MTLRRPYVPILPEFDRFLFASIGEETKAIPLSVLSALSQLGFDPRDEAARLALLTKEAATDQLARMIAQLSDARWSDAEARQIASELIKLLPVATTPCSDDSTAISTEPTTGSFLIYLALALALFVGLIAGGYVSLDG